MAFFHILKVVIISTTLVSKVKSDISNREHFIDVDPVLVFQLNTDAIIPCVSTSENTTTDRNLTYKFFTYEYGDNKQTRIELHSNDKYKIEDSTLLIHEFESSDVGWYECDITNEDADIETVQINVEAVFTSCEFNKDFCDFEKDESVDWFRRFTPMENTNRPNLQDLCPKTFPDEQVENDETPNYYIYLEAEADNILKDPIPYLRTPLLPVQEQECGLYLKVQFETFSNDTFWINHTKPTSFNGGREITTAFHGLMPRYLEITAKPNPPSKKYADSMYFVMDKIEIRIARDVWVKGDTHMKGTGVCSSEGETKVDDSETDTGRKSELNPEPKNTEAITSATVPQIKEGTTIASKPPTTETTGADTTPTTTTEATTVTTATTKPTTVSKGQTTVTTKPSTVSTGQTTVTTEPTTVSTTQTTVTTKPTTVSTGQTTVTTKPTTVSSGQSTVTTQPTTVSTGKTTVTTESTTISPEPTTVTKEPTTVTTVTTESSAVTTEPTEETKVDSDIETSETTTVVIETTTEAMIVTEPTTKESTTSETEQKTTKAATADTESETEDEETVDTKRLVQETTTLQVDTETTTTTLNPNEDEDLEGELLELIAEEKETTNTPKPTTTETMAADTTTVTTKPTSTVKTEQIPVSTEPTDNDKSTSTLYNGEDTDDEIKDFKAGCKQYFTLTTTTDSTPTPTNTVKSTNKPSGGEKPFQTYYNILLFSCIATYIMTGI